MRADQFVNHPDNWRKHTSAQEHALVSLLDSVGWVQDVVVSKRTGYVVDGHLRVLAALRKGEDTPVPYAEVDISEHEEALLLATMDPISAMAFADKIALDEIFALLPDDLAEIAKLAHAETQAPTTPVAFTASKAYRVTVDCENEAQQARLLTRLQEDGYTCRAGGKR